MTNEVQAVYKLVAMSHSFVMYFILLRVMSLYSFSKPNCLYSAHFSLSTILQTKHV